MEESLIKSYAERRKTIIPLVCRHPIFQPERDVGMMQESNEYVDALYGGIISEFIKNGMFLVYLCAPLKATYEKSGRNHVLDAIRYASQIVGADCNGKKFAIWIPHYYGLTMSNEFINPGAREFALTANVLTILQYHPTIVQVGERISEGMRSEIDCAKRYGCDVFPFEDFKEDLQNLPSLEEVEIIYNWFVRNVPPEILNHPAFNRKMKRELSTQNVPRFHDVY